MRRKKADKDNADYMTRMLIARRLESARQLSGYASRRAFSKACGIPLSSYAHHEAGLRNFYAQNILEYSQCLGVSAGWILTGEGPPKTDLDSPSKPHQDKLPLLSSSENRSTVDSQLFFHILRLVSYLFNRPDFSNDYLVDYIIEIYNNLVVNRKMTPSDKMKAAKLAVTSLRKGMDVNRRKGKISIQSEEVDDIA